MNLEHKIKSPNDNLNRLEEEKNIPNLEEKNSQTETPRTRLNSMIEEINFKFHDYLIEEKFKKLLKELPANTETEDAFIDALTTAINDFNDKNFLSSILKESAPEREEIVNQKIEEVKNKLPNQTDAVELAAKLSFNDSYLPMSSSTYKAKNVALYLRSDETVCENKFNEKATMEVSSYFLPDHESCGCRLTLNGENLINYKEENIEHQKKLQNLSEIIKSLIDTKEIKPREVVNKFISIKNNPESKACLLELLEKGSENEIINHILK